MGRLGASVHGKTSDTYYMCVKWISQSAQVEQWAQRYAYVKPLYSIFYISWQLIHDIGQYSVIASMSLIYLEVVGNVTLGIVLAQQWKQRI